MNEKDLIRVRKLLALATSPHPGEASAARKKAEQLMARHNMTLHEFENETDIIEKELRPPGEILYWENTLLLGILDFYVVEALYVPFRDKGERILLIGRRARVCGAEKMYDYLHEKLISLGEDYRSVIRDLNSFRLGMAQAVCLGLEDLKPADESQYSLTGRDIVPVDEEAAARETDLYRESRFGTLTERHQTESFDPNSLGLGRAVGRKISLLTQLKTE